MRSGGADAPGSDQSSLHACMGSRKSLFDGSKCSCWPGYVRVTGFDTMPDSDFTWSRNFSFTQQIKSEGYTLNKNARTFMCAVDATPCSERALEWMMENLVDDGDTVVAVRILDDDEERAYMLTSGARHWRHPRGCAEPLVVYRRAQRYVRAPQGACVLTDLCHRRVCRGLYPHEHHAPRCHVPPRCADYQYARQASKRDPKDAWLDASRQY